MSKKQVRFEAISIYELTVPQNSSGREVSVLSFRENA